MLTRTKSITPPAVGQPTRELSEFLAKIRFEDLPGPVVARAWRLREERDVRDFL